MSEFAEERAKVIRSMASTDPFTKLRLLALAQRYESQLGKPSRAVREIQTPATLPVARISSIVKELPQSDRSAVAIRA